MMDPIPFTALAPHHQQFVRDNHRKGLAWYYETHSATDPTLGATLMAIADEAQFLAQCTEEQQVTLCKVVLPEELQT